jgi:hypothetical protein
VAHHDAGVRGIGEELILRLQDRLAGRVRLFVTSEGGLSPRLEPLRLPTPPERLHDVLAFADFYLGDSQSVTAEAAVLGTPAFRMNDFVGRISYLRELEDYGLAFGFTPGQEERLLQALEATVGDAHHRALFQRRRGKMLSEKIDPVPWFVSTLEGLAGPGR